MREEAEQFREEAAVWRRAGAVQRRSGCLKKRRSSSEKKRLFGVAPEQFREEAGLLMLEARDVTIKYDERVAVADVSVMLAAGEITAIIGPNGAGKSTLLRALNGQLRRSSGLVLLDGEPI